MQTFLPYPSFAESAAMLDGPRLGKQRVETLQILRALLISTYGWQRHPAVAMWRGHVPALTAYGLAMTAEWTRRGAADSVRPQLVEFAPEVDGRTQEQLAAARLLPAWLGDPAVHESHRSRLIAKAPQHYGPVFPGTQRELEYVWPAAAPPGPVGGGDQLWVVRVDDAEALQAAGLIAVPALPGGRSTPAWREQLRQFGEQLLPGRVVAVLGADPSRLLLAEVVGPIAAATIGEVDHLAVAVRYGGVVERSALPVPALLQNPRRVFPVQVTEVVESSPGRLGGLRA